MIKLDASQAHAVQAWPLSLGQTLVLDRFVQGIAPEGGTPWVL
jgi:hypothetical protein